MKRDFAIIIGGSIAGLAVSKVLAESFGKVLVLEQDDAPSPNHSRHCVSQGLKPHVLTLGGKFAAEKLFPNFCNDMQHCAEITPKPFDQNIVYFLHGVHFCGGPELETLGYFYPQTRPHLEYYFYNQVKQIANVEIRHQTRAQGLLWDDTHQEVLGVTLRSGEHLFADLVVDTSGRDSRIATWLEEAGYPRPDKHITHIDLTYTSRIFHLRPFVTSPISSVFAEKEMPDQRIRSGYVVSIENDRFFVGLAGYHGDDPPTDTEGFVNFAKSLSIKPIDDAFEKLEPESEIRSYHFKEAYWYRMDQMKKYPAGILALGDAVCSMNPRFGQGMSLALQQACILQTILYTQVSRENLAHRFYKKTQPLIESAWISQAASDFLMPQTTGNRPKNLRAFQQYSDWVIKAASRDLYVKRVFLEVSSLVRRKRAMLAPLLLFRVLFDHFIRQNQLKRHYLKESKP